MKKDSIINSIAESGFRNTAKDYDLVRREFPSEVFHNIMALLKLSVSAPIPDLGAGTGRFTRLLAPQFDSIIAIEPLAAMRQQLATSLPAIDLRPGAADAIPVDSSTISAVFCVDAFHWFATEAAVVEIHRVLKAAGRLVLIWSSWDDTDQLVAELLAVVAPYRKATPSYSVYPCSPIKPHEF